jgi:hypothetical protein
MSQRKIEDFIQSCYDPTNVHTFIPQNPDDQTNTPRYKTENEMSIRKEDKVVVGAIAFLALYGGFLWWGSQPPPVKVIVPYPDLFVGPILKTVRPDPTLSAHPDGQVFWRTK